MNNILRFVIGASPSGLSPLKQDLFSAIGGNVDSSIAATSSLVGDLFNYWNVGRTNDANRDIANQNNDTSIMLARENNDLQKQELANQRAWQSEEAEKAYQRELEKMRIEMQYNSPVEQVKRLMKAGLNPALAFGGSNTASVAGASAPQASPVSSGLSPQLPTLTSPHMEAYQVNPSGAFRDIAAAAASMSMADKTDAEAQQIKQSLTDYLRKMKADADSAEIARDLEMLYGGQERSMACQKMKVEIAKATQESLNLAKEGKFIEARTILTRQQEKTEQFNSRLRGEEFKLAKQETDTFFTTFKAKIDNLQSSTSVNYANARLSGEQAITEDKLREVRKNLLGSQQRQQENAALELAEIARHYAIQNGMLPNEMSWQEIQNMYLEQIRQDLKEYA